MTWSSTATRGVTGPRRPLRGLGGFGSLAFSIPLGLSAGRPLSPFSRAISARWAATVCSRAATLPSNLTTNAFSSVGESASRSPGGAIPPENQRQACQGSENHAAATRFAAVTMPRAKSLKWFESMSHAKMPTDNKDDIDALGMMKVDVLGLGMLGCMSRAFDLLRAHKGEARDLAT